MHRQPAPGGATFAVLFVVPVLRDDELGCPRHNTVMTRCDQCGGEHGVEILNPALAALAMGTLCAMDLVRAVEFAAVERDQEPSVKDVPAVQATALLQFGDDVGKHRVKQGRFDRLELGADLTVAGDFAHAKQCFAIRAALAGFQMALVGQERGALHEEQGEHAKREIGHGIGRVAAQPLIRQSLAPTAQGSEEAVLDRHRLVESQNAKCAKWDFAQDYQFAGRCCIRDSTGWSNSIRNRQLGKFIIIKNGRYAKMRTAGGVAS